MEKQLRTNYFIHPIDNHRFTSFFIYPIDGKHGKRYISSIGWYRCDENASFGISMNKDESKLVYP